MNRTIKFRGKPIGTDRWIYGNLVIYDNGDHVIFFYDKEIGGYMKIRKLTVHPESVGQYTGLKDKDGMDIYEGDIVNMVKRNKDFTEVWSIEYDENIASFVVYNQLNSFRRINQDLLTYDGIPYVDVTEDYSFHLEVIGNIYENSDLLEGE